jgi:hypothetical protein
MSDDVEKEILSTLKDILKWTRIRATPVVKISLERALSKPEYRKLYQALDGKQTQLGLARRSGLSQPRVSSLITSWQKSGLVEEVSPHKYNRLFDLEEMGIEAE